MQAANDRMAVLGEKMENRDFSWNLIAWSTFGYSKAAAGDGLFSFQTTGDVPTIFDRQYKIGSFASGHGLCRTSISMSYNSYSSVFAVTLNDYGDGSDRAAGDECVQALDPTKLGYDPRYGSDFSLALDMRSFATAVAINTGIVDISNLVGVISTRTQVFVPFDDGSIIQGTRQGYFDPNYAGTYLF